VLDANPMRDAGAQHHIVKCGPTHCSDAIPLLYFLDIRSIFGLVIYGEVIHDVSKFDFHRYMFLFLAESSND
jgi:hypothetical protein